MKNKIRKCMSSLLLIPLLLGAEAQATIYKCVKANADVYYNDKPCPINDEESQINSVKDPEGGYIAPEFISDDKESSPNSIVIGKNSKRNIDDSKLEESSSEEIGNSENGNNDAVTGSSDSSINSNINQNDSASTSQGVTSSVNNSGGNSSSKELKKFTVTVVEPYN